MNIKLTSMECPITHKREWVFLLSENQTKKRQRVFFYISVENV